MKLPKQLTAFFAVILFITPSSCFANFAKFLSRIEISYSYVMATGQITGTSETFDLNSGTFLATTSPINKSITAKAGFGESISSYFPLVRLGYKSCMALSVEFNDCAFVWGDINTVYTTAGTYYYYGNADVTGETVQFGMPIGLDFKFGCDAMSTKDYRFCATVGTGVTTTLNSTVMSSSSYDAGGGVNFGVNPYVKGELGIRAGICMKLRCIFAFGDVPYITEKSTFSAGNLQVVGKTHTTISLVLMPFSFLWKRGSWADSPTYYRNTKYR